MADESDTTSWGPGGLIDLSGITAEPPPLHVPPMRAQPAEPPSPSEHRWAYQPCWRGQRAMIHLHGALTSLKICPPVRVLSPTGRDLTDSFPELAAMADVGPAVPTLLDAIVTTDPSTSHAARFARSQLLYRVEAPVQEADDGRQLDQPIQALVLDMVHLDGRRVGDLPYTHRRSLLLERLPDGPHWEVPSHSLRADRHLLAAAADWHTDEIVAKRLDSHYFPGMISPTWLRIPVSSFAARPLAS